MLLYDGNIEEIGSKKLRGQTGEIVDHEGKSAVLITRGSTETARLRELKGLSNVDRISAYENAIKNNGKIEIKGVKGVSKPERAKLKISKSWIKECW